MDRFVKTLLSQLHITGIFTTLDALHIIYVFLYSRPPYLMVLVLIYFEGFTGVTLWKSFVGLAIGFIQLFCLFHQIFFRADSDKGYCLTLIFAPRRCPSASTVHTR